MEERHVQLLVGKRVHDPDDAPVGRIEEIRARRDGDHHVVTEYHIGPQALLERLALRHVPTMLLRWRKRPLGYIARWDQLDLSDNEHLTLRCPIDELKPIHLRESLIHRRE